jgi:hypothetical protein
MNNPATAKSSSRAYAWIVLACGIAGLFSVLYPMFVIRPFRAQGARELDAALLVMRIRPALTLVCALLAAFGTMRYWRRELARSRKIAVAAGLFVACASAVLARVNVFELMFHPVGSPAFESTAATRLDTDEKVLAVQVNGAARAYPIRAIAYHHIVNDTVGGTPIAATY